MKLRKILAAFVSVVMMCPVVSVPAFAAEETQIVTDSVSPAYEYATSTQSYALTERDVDHIYQIYHR